MNFSRQLYSNPVEWISGVVRLPNKMHSAARCNSPGRRRPPPDGSHPETLKLPHAIKKAIAFNLAMRKDVFNPRGNVRAASIKCTVKKWEQARVRKQ
jgi:hypothetical protein